MLWIMLWTLFIFILSFVRASASVWLISFLILCLLMFKYLEVGFTSIFISTIIIIVLPLCIPLIRCRIISYLLKKFNKSLPKISITEKEAINAGDCGWEKDILSGSPSWRKLHNIAKPKLSEEEQHFIDGSVKELMSMINDWKIIFNDVEIPENIWKFLKEKGFFGMIISKEYGGLEFSPFGISRVFSMLYAKSVTVATTVSVPNSIGPGELLMHYGTEKQKKYYLPRLARGEEIPCFALTSEFAGSDATAMLDSGVVCYGEYEGNEILGIKLNWNKRYITLAPVATLLGLAVKLYDPKKLLGKKTEIGITCVLIPSNMPGISIGRRHYPLYTPFQNGPIQGKNVFIPFDFVIGGKDMVGKGWRMLMETLAAGRAIALPSSAVGESQQVLMATSSYSMIREQFNSPIGFFEGIQEPLARIAANTYMIDALCHFTITVIQNGSQASVASAISKYHSTEMARKIIKDAMDIHGGKGICLGPKNYLSAFYTSAPISITVEGANILTRSLIIFGQGLTRCHPYLLDELSAIEDNEIKRLDCLLCRHFGHIMHNLTRSVIYALSSGFFIKSSTKRLKKYYKRLSKYSIYLSFISDLVLLIYQGGFKRKESLSGRLGDILSYIYIGSAVLKKYYDEGELAEEQPLIKWIMEYLCYEIEEKFCDIINNFNIPVLRYGIYYLLFPYGKYSKIPTDNLDRDVANLVLTPSETRKKITRLSYTEEINNEQCYSLNKLFFGLHNEKKLYKIVKDAKKVNKFTGSNPLKIIEQAFKKNVISEDERNRLFKLEALRLKIIKVDDFPFDGLKRKK